MSSNVQSKSVSRRTALTGLGAGGIGIALAATTRQSNAQADAADMVNRPMVGSWLVASRLGPSMTIYGPDGSFLDSGLAIEAGPNGNAFLSSTIGRWEPISERGIHFTAVQVQSDANGNYLGSLTVDGHPTASEDGRTFSDDDPETTLTIRGAEHAIVRVITPYAANDGSVPPRTGVRIDVGLPGFPEATPEAGTPTT
jgi:hypothetical protein